MNSTKINRGGLNSSFSSLLHQRIFLSSRGARQYNINYFIKNLNILFLVHLFQTNYTKQANVRHKHKSQDYPQRLVAHPKVNKTFLGRRIKIVQENKNLMK